MNCTVITNTTTQVRVITFQSYFAINETFAIQINGVINPYYADNFVLTAAINNTNFITSGILTILSA